MAASDPETTTTRHSSTTNTQNGAPIMTIESINDINCNCTENNNCDRNNLINNNQRVSERVQQWNRAIPEEGYITLGTIRYGVRLSTRSSPSPIRKTISSSPKTSRILRNHSNSPSSLLRCEDSSNKTNQEENINRCDSNSSTTSSNYKTTCCCIGTTVSLPSWKINNIKNCCSDDSSNNRKVSIPLSTAKNNKISSSQLSSLSSSSESSFSQPKNIPLRSTITTKLTTNNKRSKTTIPRLSATLDPEIIEFDNPLDKNINNNKNKQNLNETNKFVKMSTNLSYNTIKLDTTTPTLTTSKLQIPSTTIRKFSTSNSNTTNSTATTTVNNIKENENENNFIKGKYKNFHDTLIEQTPSSLQQKHQHQQHHRCYIPQKIKHVSELCQICSTNTINSIILPCTSEQQLKKNNQYHQQQQQQQQQHHHHQQIHHQHNNNYVAIHKNSSSSCCRQQQHEKSSSEDSVLVESLIPSRELLYHHHQINNKTIIPKFLSVKNSTTINRNSSSSTNSQNSDEQFSIQKSSKIIKPIEKICCYEINENNKKFLNNNKTSFKIYNKNNNNNNNNSNIPRAILQQSLDNSQNLIKLNNLKKNYHRHRLSPPPPVPPKPFNHRTQIVRSKSVDSHNENNYNIDQQQNDDQYDPLNFRRKIQKFEQKNILQHYQPQNSTINRFEFFNCFSSNNNNKNYHHQQLSTVEQSTAIIKSSPILFGEINEAAAANQSIECQNQKQKQQLYKQNGGNIHESLLCNQNDNDKNQLVSDDIIDKSNNELSIINTICQSNSDSKLKLNCNNNSESSSTIKNIVIRTNSPNLSKKSFLINNNNNISNSNCCTSKNIDNSNFDRGDSENRLIVVNQEDNFIDQKTIINQNNNNNCDNCNDKLIIVHCNNNNNNNNNNNSNNNEQQDEIINGIPFYDDDSDIGFIDSSGDNNSSSVSSDFDSNHQIKYFDHISKSPTLPLLSYTPVPFPPPNYPTTLLRSSSTGEQLIKTVTITNINNNRVRGPLIKRIPAIESFGFITNNQHQQELNTNSQNKEIIMEKRRNTLDRLQRLGFGRRSTSSPTQSTDKSKKSTEKSERLKELTELLKGNHRCSPTPPPIPPPRKQPRSQSNSFDKIEKSYDPASSTSPSSQSPLRAADSEDIIAMDEEDSEEHIPITQPLTIHLKPNEMSADGPVSAPLIPSPQKSTLYQTLRPNTSVSNLEAFLFRRNNREISKSPPPVQITYENNPTESCISSYTQKENLYRSASFSQVDYSSGKYIKSTLNALRDKFRRDKSNRQQSVIDNANLTLPRKKDDNRGKSVEPDFIYIPLKKSELNINLKYENEQTEKISLEERVNPPDVIMEEESQHVDIEKLHSNDEIIDDVLPENNDVYETEETNLPTTLDDKLNENTFQQTEPIPVNGNYEDSCQSNLATLTEEEIPMESPPENFLQTATTCLIPVPVYECLSHQWEKDNPTDQWVDMASDEIRLNLESIDPMPTVLNKDDLIEEVLNNFNDQQNDTLPIISVSTETPRDSIDETPSPSREINLSRLSVERSFEEMISSNSDKLLDKPIEFTEVKKRYSNDETKIGDRSQSADSILPRTGNSADEKRRIDKSRRRKGMYIQWPALERDVSEICVNSDWNHSTESSSNDDKALTVDISKVDFSDIKSESSGGQTPGSLFLHYPPTDDSRTPGSLCSFDPSTPESDYNGRPPIWPRTINRRTSLSCQSSEEKDDVPSNNTSSHRNQRSLHLFKNDSISDNESDRTPPPSRDRTSPSPAPGELDLKRYSKRPLRGPYGQMLEAEMKKPGKLQYDEILEELKDTEEFTKLTGRTRSSQSNRSFDNTRTIPQYSSSMRVRKSNAYLPVPAHTRAASTPSQMENINTNTPTSIDSINTQEKRYQSNNLFDTTISSESYSIMDSSSSTIRTSTGKDIKNCLVDNNKIRDRSPKRASSEIPNTKQYPKRSLSTASDRHQQDKQKRSLEEIRLSQSSRTPSERSMVSESGKTNNGGTNRSDNLVPTPELLAALLKGSSERQISTERQQMFADTRSHVVHEIFQHEQNYVDALNTVAGKYLHVLKTPECAGMIDSRTVDEIFYMIPEILAIHEKFLNELQSRLDTWDSHQKVGDVFLETFSKTEVLETYTCYVNNCNRAEDAIRITKQSRPSFAKFLAITASKHAGKLSLSNFLIKPVQKFPHYEMLFKRLIKNTDADHPDQKPLEEVLKLAKEISVHLDCKKKEVNENGQREATLKELENVIDGITELLAPERLFLGFETVSVVSSGQNARKDRGFFLFSDLLVLTSIKRIKKPNTTTYSGSIASTLDTNNNKYKFLIKVSLDNIEILKTKDENLRKKMNEIEDLISDSMKWQQICEITASLKSQHQWFEEKARDYLGEVQRTLTERQSNDTQLNLLELLINLPSGSQNLSIAFNKAEKRTQWEEMINEAKQKLAASLERHPIPEFKISIAICKTRAGLQFTCAAPILSDQKDVWVCNSDGYIGQVGILSINPEPPTVKICAGICNARILCVASVPAATNDTESKSREPSVEEIQSNSCRNSNSSNYNVKTITTDKTNDTATTDNNSTIKNPKISSIKSDNNESDMQLDSNSSSDDSEPEGGGNGLVNSGSVASGILNNSSVIGGGNPIIERVPSPAPTIASNSSVSTTTTSGTVFHQQQDSNSDETDCQQSTMWLGTEDGCIHVYNCNDNIRTKKNKLKIEHKSAVYSIMYLDNRVFVSLANGDIYVYLRDSAGWNTQTPLCISIGTVSSPVNKLLNVHGKLWCSIQGIIKIIDTKTLQVENQIQISSDSKPITNMVVCNNYVWISIQNSAHIKCFHSNSHELMFEINLAPSVNKMLSNCDDIIRQHKAACLRVTSLLACKDLIWIGTSAGVLLTIPAQGYSKGQTNNTPIVTGIPHGHTGHVRFLTCIDSGLGTNNQTNNTNNTTNPTRNTSSSSNNFDKNSKRNTMHTKTISETGNILIISGGDGYENFGNSGSLSEIAGREDSTNHLLIWQI